VGAEEHKLGIRGSSTCPLILNDCPVPAENLLGEIGKGHHIAFNILNIGRFKLGASAVGAARHSLQHAVRYAKDRKAFGKSISDFGLIQEKLAECAAGIYVGEALSYRTIGMIDSAVAGLTAARDIQTRIEEYAVECSILKVWGSEMLDMVVDHVVQIYGGFGYVEDYPAAAAYRDSRINRIFEGTNEINRLIITGFLLKRAVAGQLPLLAAIKRIMDEVMESPSAAEDTEGPLAAERKLLTIAKKLTLFAAGAASQKHMLDMAEQQEIMGAMADCIIQVYALESALLRAEKSGAEQAIALTQFHSAHAIQAVEASAKKVIAAVAEGDLLRTQLAMLRRIGKYEIANVVALSRQIAKHVVDAAR
jgi:butyryl-CoA dehydrogenase